MMIGTQSANYSNRQVMPTNISRLQPRAAAFGQNPPKGPEMEKLIETTNNLIGFNIPPLKIVGILVDSLLNAGEPVKNKPNLHIDLNHIGYALKKDHLSEFADRKEKLLSHMEFVSKLLKSQTEPLLDEIAKLKMEIAELKGKSENAE